MDRLISCISIVGIVAALGVFAAWGVILTTQTALWSDIDIAITAPRLSSSFDRWNIDDVEQAYQASGLEFANPTRMRREDYGPAPLVASAGTRFLIPSLCEDCGGRVFTFSSANDLQSMKDYYEVLPEVSAWLFSWVFVRDNVLVQINGDLPEERARQYEGVLSSLQ